MWGGATHGQVRSASEGIRKLRLWIESNIIDVYQCESA